MVLQDEAIDIYLFSSDSIAEQEAAYIDYGGCSYYNGTEGINVSWVSYPHFYRKGSIIVQYVGEDETIISDLEDILGDQFAGYRG